MLERPSQELSEGLHTDIEVRKGILLATVSGYLTFDTALRMFMKVFETAKEKEVRKILFNVLAVDGELSTLERYNLGIESVAYLTRCLPNIRIAVVGKQPAMDGFGVRVGQNRGVAAETFSTQEQALKWLARWPS